MWTTRAAQIVGREHLGFMLSGWAAATVVFCLRSCAVGTEAMAMAMEMAMMYQMKWLVALLMTLFISTAAGQTQLPDEATSALSSTPSPATPQPSLPKLPVAVHYETLCPDSVYFIRRRLYDALLDNDWWNRTDLKLYPFGKAAVSGRREWQRARETI